MMREIQNNNTYWQVHLEASFPSGWREVLWNSRSYSGYYHAFTIFYRLDLLEQL